MLVDYAVGFANLLRSHELSEHLNNVLGLAKTAKWYGSGLVVTNGEASKPSGPLYPQLLEVIGDHPVIERSTAFNSFLDADFAAAVRAAGRPNPEVDVVERCHLSIVRRVRTEVFSHTANNTWFSELNVFK